ncbi:hypothetical protein LTR09_010404 [Extremus antarcticus]|uniref:DUF654-domain-containing protein n=1 Tax=Extremus antarcticus TaxID=702011 RepID=A0AAJ0DDZ1_9PEZI|nr:hypothetical protein LTR09_010404 [Extremus antarcticus]
MSSRALRKAQREREEQERLEAPGEDIEWDDEDEDVPVPVKPSAFAMLAGDDEEEEAEDQDEEVHEDKADEQSKNGEVDSIPTAPSKKKKKKKKKKASAAGGGETPQGKDDDEGIDEIDLALKQLSANGNTSLSASTTAGVSAQTEETSKLLAIDTSHLHAQNEMRRLFGRAAIEQRDDDEGVQGDANVGGNRRQQRRVQQMGLAQALRGQQGGGRAGGLAAMALKRNIFIQGKEEWPNATGGGLGMEIEEKRADGTILYRYAHNTTYRDAQHQFDIAVESMDPQRLVVLLQQNPYHIATLLQVSEIAKQDRNHTVSGDLLERALFSFGRAVHSSFAKTLAAGKARLDFKRPQNRELWLASWRYMQNLSMRATWRTVYEWAKLLLQLSPEEDPYAMWLALDQYALRARQDIDYLNLSRSPIFKDRLQSMPNVALSQGLAEWRAGNKSKGQQALFKTVGQYPWVVARLMQELNLQPPPAVWGKEPRTECEKLQTELYATRAKDLWATPEASAFLMEVASALPPDVEPAKVDAEAKITESQARHVLLSDTPALISLIPRGFTEQLQSSSDPLPPSGTYEPAAPREARTQPPSAFDDIAAETVALQEWFTSILPANRRPTTEEDVLAMAARGGVTPEELQQRIIRMEELRDMLVEVRDGPSDENDVEEEDEEQGEDEMDAVSPARDIGGMSRAEIQREYGLLLDWFAGVNPAGGMPDTSMEEAHEMAARGGVSPMELRDRMMRLTQLAGALAGGNIGNRARVEDAQDEGD